MPQVNADPEKLRHLARTLSNSSHKLEQLSREMRRAVDQTDWKDSERAKFDQDFQQTLRAITKFGEQIKSQYVPALNKKAASLDAYRS